jgi:hypothetical protein
VHFIRAAAFALPTLFVIPAKDTPVRLRLSDGVYVAGDRARVTVKTAKDGYLVVMRVDTEGRVRVLFPIDPVDSANVRGGKEFEIKGRGDRNAFTVSEKQGAGLVFAAFSEKPFDFTPFATGSHWNFDALVPEGDKPDPEAAMLNLVDRMGDKHYDYDALPYSVGEGVRRPMYAMYDPFYYSPFSMGVGIGMGYQYMSPWPFYTRGGYRTIYVPIRPFHGRRR